MRPYRLINRLGSGGFVIEAALTLADIPFELDLITSDPSSPLPDKFRDQNPWGQVPVLMTPDDSVLTEYAAILFYLTEQHKSFRQGPNLFVQDFARFYRWTSFLATNVYEGILRQSYPDRYATYPSIPREQLSTAVRSAAKIRTHNALRIIENELADTTFLCGLRLSSVDVFLAMLYAWHNPQPDLPRCKTITEIVANHEKIAGSWFRNFDHRLDYRWQVNGSGSPPRPDPRSLSVSIVASD